MSVADTVFPWVILGLFIAVALASYYFGSKRRYWMLSWFSIEYMMLMLIAAHAEVIRNVI